MLAGRTFLLTGATDGIGKHTAKRLLDSGATVIVHGRSKSRVDEVASPHKNAIPVVADLADFASVRQLAEYVKAAAPQGITTLINNAGVYEDNLKITKDGLELTHQVNVAAPFLLTSLLLASNHIKERIVNVASISASSSLDHAIITGTVDPKSYSSHRAYSTSKLGDILFTLSLARRLREAGSMVTANALDPGTVNTKMLFAGWGPCGIDVGDANDEYWVATAPELEGVSGKYYVGRRESRPPGSGNDINKVQEELWALLERQTGAVWSK
jgi:NAD(P)-dependent dehydrogenase (short-subunit alcohol dehydrogenase family)